MDKYWIAIDSTLAPEVQRDRLFWNVHWIMSALCGVEISSDHREQIAVAMYTILRDNQVLLNIADISGISELRIAGNVITLEFVDELDTNGEYERKYNRMKIKNIVPHDRKPQTLLHEIYHVIFDSLCIEKVGSTERDIWLLAWFTTLLLHQNDFSWMLDEEVEK